jgi:hypothetical protein
VQISRTITDAYNLTVAMDAYEGTPTAAQLRELDWLWDDAISEVTSLNKITHQEVPVPKRQ